jgi:hypothetical protein
MTPLPICAKTSAQIDLPRKGGGNKRGGVAIRIRHGFHFRKLAIKASPSRWLFSG